jgi:hypothetical protein
MGFIQSYDPIIRAYKTTLGQTHIVHATATSLDSHYANQNVYTHPKNITNYDITIADVYNLIQNAYFTVSVRW